MSGYVFREFEWQTEEPDARAERLCEVTAPLADKRRIDCRLEGMSFTAADVPPKDEIVVMAYNVERGLRADEQIAALRAEEGLPLPDIILMSEADRGCSRTGYRNVAAEYARRLGMNYVFGVEFVELPRWWGAGLRLRARCEHGNAILSRYPLGNVRLMRHRRSRSWHSWPQRLLRVGEPREGGRMALAADVEVGGRYLRVYSVHFESGRRSELHRVAQAMEVTEDASRSPLPAVIGGDMNAGAYLHDLRRGSRRDGASIVLRERGFADAHSGLPSDARVTTRSGVAIDLIFGRRVRLGEAGIGPPEPWERLSDHLPVWAKVRLR